MKNGFLFRASSFFVLLSIVFVPFPFNLFPYQLDITEFIFGKIVGFVSANLFGHPLADTHVHSDTRALYILVLLLGALALLCALIAPRIEFWKKNAQRIISIIKIMVCYYLALQLLKYGFDKVFKNQFYIPEPNTLYTRLGDVPRDLLYWSAMGTSRFYSIFLGSIEVLAAILLLIRRTRLAGLLLSFFLLINIVAINFGFDVSVKAFSLLLLSYSAYLLVPFGYDLYHFIISGKNKRREERAAGSQPEKLYLVTLQWFIGGLLFVEALYPFVRSGQFNGDTSRRPFMHGAYEVKQFVSGADTLSQSAFPFKRFFIHKNDWLIFQDANDQMADYKLVHEPGGDMYSLVDYQMRKRLIQLEYRSSDSTLTLHYKADGKEQVVTGKGLNWRQLPALKKEFHWTID